MEAISRNVSRSYVERYSGEIQPPQPEYSLCPKCIDRCGGENLSAESIGVKDGNSFGHPSEFHVMSRLWVGTHGNYSPFHQVGKGPQTA